MVTVYNVINVKVQILSGNFLPADGEIVKHVTKVSQEKLFCIRAS